MVTQGNKHRARLSIDVDSELRRQIKIAAAARDLSIRDYVVGIIRAAIAAEQASAEATERAEWSHLSIRSFARDWESEADRVYDELS
jgi:hypothetical protein